MTTTQLSQNQPPLESIITPISLNNQHHPLHLENNQRRRFTNDRIARVLNSAPFINRHGKSDGEELNAVKLSVVSRDGIKVCVDVDRAVLVEKSRFFKDKLCSKAVEICVCDEDLEAYLEVLVLMHFQNVEDLKMTMRAHDVSAVLGLLKVSAALMFDVGIISCLEYLEAVPWSEEEEEKILLQLNQIWFSDSVNAVLKRVVPNQVSTSARADEMLSRLITGVLQSKDGKARREMKNLLSMLLNEESFESHEKLDFSKDALYDLCHGCLSSLILCLSEATGIDELGQEHATLMGEIAKEVDNIQWIVDILIDRKIGDEFVKLWADQKDLATLHSKIPVMCRHDISRITAHLLVAIGRGLVLVPTEVRSSLLSTWLEALYNDFKWMRTPKSLDRNLVEHGLGTTILTLPLQQQQSILLDWFDRFLNEGDDCPKIHRAFKIWWRRIFIRQRMLDSEKPQLQIVVNP